jgi:C-terminal processing protease CtpA/Prc
MRRFLLPVLFGGILSAQVHLANPGFEEGEVGVVPTGWALPSMLAQAGFTAKLVDRGCRTGRCAMLTGIATPPPNMFGNLMQSISADGYKLRRIRLRAAMRVEGMQTRGQMWLRLDRDDRTMAFLENMGRNPVTSPEWKTYDIVTDVPEDVSHIALGFMVFGPGNVWVDDASLEVIGEIRKDKVEPARPLTARAVINLTAFAKLYGYVQHFHPSDQAAGADWDTFAVEGIRKVEDAANTAELIERLRAVFQPVAPAVQVFATGQRPKSVEPAGGTGFLRYKHVGMGLPSPQAPIAAYSAYKTWREPLGTGAAPPKPFEAELVPGISASVPLAVATDSDGTLPHAGGRAEPVVYERTGDDRTTRLADVVIAWNVFQHFYPYFDVVKTDWPAELPKALRSAATDANGVAFQKTLERLVAALHDGHGRVSSTRMQAMLVPPVTLDWVEKQFVVTRVRTGAVEGVAPGDRVLKIDGKPIDEAAAEARSLISAATDGWMRSRTASELSKCNPDTRRMQLELEPFAAPGTSKSVVLDCAFPKFKDPETYTEPRPVEKVAELEPGIFYVDLDRVDDNDWAAAVPRLAAAKGIVFDMRGYPAGPGIQSLAHLTDNTIRSARWNIPTPNMPDRLDSPFVESGWPVAPQKPYFTAKRAFLIDGRAISYAETVMGIVENFKLGEIVGEPTAGTNGNVNPFKLPGGYTISWTGMKVLKHDGSQHHGIGIVPTVPASRTRKGVSEGKDEILMKGLEVVKR